MADSPLESPPVPLADSLFNRLAAFGKESARRGEAYMADSSGAGANPGDIVWNDRSDNRWALGIPRADGVWNVTHPVGIYSFLSAQEVEDALTGWNGWHLDRAPKVIGGLTSGFGVVALGGTTEDQSRIGGTKPSDRVASAVPSAESDARAAAFKALVNLLNDTSADVTARAAELILQHTAP